MNTQPHPVFLTLLQTQKWKRPAVVAYQLQLLEGLCRHARAHVPFYRDTGRLDPLFDADDRFVPDAWADIPLLTRAEAWRHRLALCAETVPSVMQPLMPGNTTGSTGVPLPYLRTAASRAMAQAQLARAMVWRGLGVLNPVAISKAVTGDIAGREAGDAQSAPAGPVHHVDFHDTPGEQAARLDAIRPRLILTYPSIALGWIAAGYRFTDVHALVLTGETCTPEMRLRIEQVFQGPVVEVYSASEAGPIAIESATRRGKTPVLAVCEENIFLENPHPDAPRDDPHPVIVTPFYSYGTPLIRYMPGDYAIFNYACGSQAPGLRRLDRVTGRLRNMFRRRDGSLFWPNLSGVKMMAIAPHSHRQLIQEDHDHYRLRIVFDGPVTPEQREQLSAHIRQVTGGGNLVIEAVDAIDDGRKQGKAYENFVCRIAAPESGAG